MMGVEARMNAGTGLVALLVLLVPAAAGARAGFAVSALEASLAAAPRSGTVFTTEGGRMRGTILDATPAGVTIQLADGSTRSIPAAQIARIDFSDGTSWAPGAPQPQAVAAAPTAGPAPAPAAPPPAAAPPAPAASTAPAAASTGAGVAAAAPPGAPPPAAAGPAATGGAQPVPAAWRAPPIVLPIDRLDSVYLANGGRVRGLVVEEVPSQGVLMRLIDGTERRYAPGEVIVVQYADGTVSAQAKPAK
jgi:hypothetical protein